MEQEITPELTKAFTRRAFALGYQVEQRENDTDHYLIVSLHGQQVCSFQRSGAMYFDRDSPLAQGAQELHDLFLSTKQEYIQYADAEPLNIEGITGFRRIAEYGDFLLAARIGEDGEVKYVTWQYDHDHTGVTTGHYFETNAEGAKQDFAIRAGLVQECKVFGREEMEVLYHACMVCAQSDCDMTFENEEKLQEITGKLAQNLPGLEDGREEVKKVQVEEENLGNAMTGIIHRDFFRSTQKQGINRAGWLGDAKETKNMMLQETVNCEGLIWEEDEYGME